MNEDTGSWLNAPANITGTVVIDDNNDITDNDGPDDIDDDRDWTMGAGGGAL